jgi:hypothetical protein
MGLISRFIDYLNGNNKTWRFYLDSVLGNELLKVNPIGWDEIGLTLERDELYEGIFRTYSAELEFVKNGYDILKELFDTYGILADCSLTVYKRNPQTQVDTEVFSSKLDFTEYKELTTNKKGISLTMVDSSFQEKLKSREDIDIPYDRETDLDDNTMPAGTYETVSIIGRQLGSEAEALIYQEVDPGDDFNEYDMGTLGGFFPLNVEFPTIEILPNFQNVIKVTEKNLADFTTEDAFYYSDLTSAEVFVTFNYNLQSSAADSDFVRIDKIKFNRSGDYVSIEQNLFLTSINVTAESTFTGSTTLEPLEGLVLYFTHASAKPASTITIKEGTDLKARDRSTFQPIDRSVILPHEAFSQVCHSITGEADSFRSTYFGRTDLGYDEDGEGAYVGLTKGLLLRGYPIGYLEEEPEDQELSERVAQVAFKFKELFESYKKLKNLSVEILLEDGKYIIQVEKKDDLYGYEIAHTLESSDVEDNSFERQFQIKNVISKIQAGYNTQKEDLLGGLEEYSSKIEHSTKLSEVINNDLNLIIPYIGASVPFEKTRRKPKEATATEQTTYDDNILFFDMYNDGGNLIQRTDEGYSEINGLDYVTDLLNVSLTPKQILRAHGDTINIGLVPYPTSKAKFNSAAKTTDLSYIYDGETTLIQENGDEIVGNLESPRFTGNILVFNAPISLETFIDLRNNPNRLIKVWSELDNKYVYGWLKKVSTEPVDTETNWELLEAHPNDVGDITVLQVNNDLLQLDDDSLLQVT